MVAAMERPRSEGRTERPAATKELVGTPAGGRELAPRVELDKLSTPQLIARLAQDAQTLVKAEIELGKTELRAGVNSGLTTLAKLALATLLALMAASLFATGAVLALAQVVPAWAAALIVGGALALASVVAFSLARGPRKRRAAT
jgi:hypothetical protein